MDPSFARALLSTTALFACACQLLNPKWDDDAGEDADSGSASGAVSDVTSDATSGVSSGDSETVAGSSTSTGTSTSDSATTTITAGTSATDTSTSGATGTSTTGDAECKPIGAQCIDPGDCCGCSECVGGTCQADEGASCGECQVCDGGGECVLEPVDAPCGDAIDCATLSCGPANDGRCRACAGEEFGRCDGGGACTPAAPSGCLDNGLGEIAVPCTTSCIKDSDACPQLVAVDTLVADDYCLNDGSITAGCHDQCANEALYSEVRQFRCWEGGCKTKGNAISCDKYRCDLEADVCFDSCQSGQQCIFAFTCMNSECT